MTGEMKIGIGIGIVNELLKKLRGIFTSIGLFFVIFFAFSVLFGIIFIIEISVDLFDGRFDGYIGGSNYYSDTLSLKTVWILIGFSVIIFFEGLIVGPLDKENQK